MNEKISTRPVHLEGAAALPGSVRLMGVRALSPRYGEQERRLRCRYETGNHTDDNQTRSTVTVPSYVEGVTMKGANP